MKNLLLFTLSLLAFSLSYSQEWKSFGEQNGEEYFIRPNTTNTAWLKVLNGDVPVDFKKFGMDKTEKGKTVTLFKFDCRKKKLGVLAVIYYNNDDKVLYSKQYSEALVALEYPFPDTVREGYLKTFCELE